MVADLRRIAGLLSLVICLAIGVSPLWASDSTAQGPTKDLVASRDQGSDQKLTELEGLIEAQRSKIESLQSQLNAIERDNTQAMRTEEVRKVVRELMADSTFRETLYPDVTQVGYDKGFYIKSSDEDFLLKISGFLKVRYTGAERQKDNPLLAGKQKRDDINGFEIEDLYLYFQGHIHSPKLTYSIVLTGETDDQHNWRTYTAHINYEFAKEVQVVAGLVKIPFGRQWLVSKSDLQLIDRSMVNEAFSPGRSVGVGVHGTIAKRLSYVMAMANGIADQNSNLGQLDSNFAYAARLVGHILGEPIRTESDLAYSKDPQLEVGASFAYNDENADNRQLLWYSIPERIRSGRGIGGNGTTALVGTDLAQFGVDAAFRYRGLSVTAEYFLRNIDGENEWSQWEQRTMRDDWSHQQGGYIQAGYFVIPKKVELAARLGGIWDNGNDNTWEYTFGVNYFPLGTNNLLLQMDYTRIEEAPTTSTAGNWGQNDDINMVRVQLMARF